MGKCVYLYSVLRDCPKDFPLPGPAAFPAEPGDGKPFKKEEACRRKQFLLHAFVYLCGCATCNPRKQAGGGFTRTARASPPVMEENIVQWAAPRAIRASKQGEVSARTARVSPLVMERNIVQWAAPRAIRASEPGRFPPALSAFLHLLWRGIVCSGAPQKRFLTRGT